MLSRGITAACSFPPLKPQPSAIYPKVIDNLSQGVASAGEVVREVILKLWGYTVEDHRYTVEVKRVLIVIII